MPYIKTKDLEHLLQAYFRAGCNAGYGISHDEHMIEQEVKAFEDYHNKSQKVNGQEINDCLNCSNSFSADDKDGKQVLFCGLHEKYVQEEDTCKVHSSNYEVEESLN